jgi:hypothetical protein
LFNVNWPEAIVGLLGLQVVEPVNVPESVDPESVAVPDVLVVQPENAPSNPPFGIVRAKVNVLPATLPLTVPRPVTVWPLAVAVAVTVPVTDAPDWLSASDIVPLPVESDADPFHVPARFAGDSGAAGFEAVVPLVQPMKARVTARHAQRKGRRRRSTAINNPHRRTRVVAQGWRHLERGWRMLTQGSKGAGRRIAREDKGSRGSAGSLGSTGSSASIFCRRDRQLPTFSSAQDLQGGWAADAVVGQTAHEIVHGGHRAVDRRRS